MAGQIAILIDARLHNELVLRTRSTADVTNYIEHAIQTFLERTEGDAHLWSLEYIDAYDEERADDAVAQYGSPTDGYYWQALHLPNGTKLRITYKGSQHYAEVRHKKIMDGNASLSPSEWARKVANNTNRNAWRDIWVKRPEDHDWQFADQLRRNLTEVRR